MARFVLSFQMDFPLREIVYNNRHYDIGDFNDIKASNFVQCDDSTTHSIDWHNLRAFFPIDDGSEYKAVILYQHRGLVAVRNSTASLINRVTEVQCLRYESDMVRSVGRALQIKRFVPYVCGDLVLMPVRKNRAGHMGWIRITPDAELESINSTRTSISYTDIGPIWLAMSPKVLKSRLENLNTIHFHLTNYAKDIIPDQIPDKLRANPKKPFSGKVFLDRLNNFQFQYSVKKITGEQVSQEIIDEGSAQIQKNNFRPLDDEALG